MEKLVIYPVAALSDNYAYVLHFPQSQTAAVVDPAEADPVLRKLTVLRARLTHILNTHHHSDHVGGNLELKRKTSCQIIGSRQDSRRIPGLDQEVDEGDTIQLGQTVIRVFSTRGHTTGHLMYWVAKHDALFTGDTLFSLGCGRLFEGTASQMWESLSRLKELPPNTNVYCGHEYTQSNARFALTIDPENPKLLARVEEINRLRTQGQPTIPVTLEEEFATNPFLRPNDPKIREHLGMETKKDVEVFVEIRQQKDRF